MTKAFKKSMVKKEVKEVVSDYYANSDAFVLPEQSSFRQYRIKRLDGSFRKIKARITSVTKLKTEIAFFKGDIKAIYYTTTKWLNPTAVGKKVRPGYPDIPLSFDIPLDFDSEDLEEARLNALKALERAKQLNHKIKYIAFSGCKGFHIVLENTQPIPERHQDREAFISHVLSQHYKLYKDFSPDECMTNPRMIIKLPGTYNPNGYTTTIISEEQLRQPIETLLTHIPHDSRGRPLSPIKRAMIHHPPLTREREANRRGQRLTFQTFLKNKVKGTRDRYVLFLKYEATFPLSKLSKKLKWLMHTYKLSNFYIYKDAENYYAVNLSTHSPRRIAKITTAAKSLNNGIQHRIPITQEINLEGAKTMDRPTLIQTIESPYNKQTQSLPHHQYYKLTPTHQVCGEDKMVYITTTQTRKAMI